MFFRKPVTGRSAAFAAALVCAVLLMSIPAATCAAGSRAQVEKSWDIERLDVAITVNHDSSFHVKESVLVNFRGSFSYLTHPISTRRGSFSEGRTYGGVKVKNIEVTDLSGNPLASGSYEVKGTSDGPQVKLNFSATNEQKGWIFEYDYRGAIIFGEDADRLYYNAVGADRPVPVKQSRVTVSFPAGTDMSQVQYTSYDTPGIDPGSVQSGIEGDTVWYATGEIPAGSAFTIDVQFPKSVVSPPWMYSNWYLVLMIVLSCLAFFGILTVMLVLWWHRGRDVGAPALDVVRYEPPPGLRPAMAGMLVNEHASTSDISATIVDLAVRGKLLINEYEKGRVFKRTGYGFTMREGADTSELLPYEHLILSGLFESGKPTVTEDDLEDKFYTHVGGITAGVKDEVLALNLFDGDPRKVKGRFWMIGLAVLVVGVFVAVWLARRLDMGYLYVLGWSLVPCGLVIGLVGRYMPRRTAKGSEALSYVNGFKEYMATAEKGELDWMTPENFQTNLPYAMVLGVSDKWASSFADIYTSPPDWYTGYSGTFSVVYLAQSMSNMQTNLGSTLTSSPSSSGGGGGGFGGGSSGGGFGGGGFSAG